MWYSDYFTSRQSEFSKAAISAHDFVTRFVSLLTSSHASATWIPDRNEREGKYTQAGAINLLENFRNQIANQVAIERDVF